MFNSLLLQAAAPAAAGSGTNNTMPSGFTPIEDDEEIPF